MAEHAVDVAIVGAGPAGAALAAALAPRLGVALIERAAAPSERIGESLPPPALVALSRLGLGPAAEDAGHLPYRGVRAVWAEPAITTQDFLRAPYGPGLHLDRARFDAALVEAATARGARLIRPARLNALEHADVGWRLRLQMDGREIEIAARLVVDATGRRAALARRLKVRRIALDRLTATYARLPASPRAQSGFTLIEAVAEGWWYAAPVPGGSLVAFHTDADLISSAEMRGGGWRAALAKTRLVGTCGTAPAEDPPLGIVAAGSARLERAAGDGWLAVGDAAASFDPLSSQGLLNALTTALLARDAIRAHLAGDGAALTAYAETIGRVFALYRERLAMHYGEPRRFAGSPFWARRSGVLFEAPRLASHMAAAAAP